MPMKALPGENTLQGSVHTPANAGGLRVNLSRDLHKHSLPYLSVFSLFEFYTWASGFLLSLLSSSFFFLLPHARCVRGSYCMCGYLFEALRHGVEFFCTNLKFWQHFVSQPTLGIFGIADDAVFNLLCLTCFSSFVVFLVVY